MPKRTVKHNHLVSTYPCNNGYVTETVNRNCETIRTAFDTNLYDAERRHNNYLRDLQKGGANYAVSKIWRLVYSRMSHQISYRI